MPAIINGADNFNSNIANPTNNSSAVSDITLGILQSCYIDVTAQTSVPLHIATGDNQIYQIFAELTTSSSSTPNVVLQPNNTALTNFFQGVGYQSNGSSSISASGAFYNGFALSAASDPRIIDAIISTKTTSKSYRSMAYGLNSGGPYQSTLMGSWMATASSGATQDTTTLYNSLGTIISTQAMTGRFQVRRLA